MLMNKPPLIYNQEFSRMHVYEFSDYKWTAWWKGFIEDLKKVDDPLLIALFINALAVEACCMEVIKIYLPDDLHFFAEKFKDTTWSHILRKRFQGCSNDTDESGFIAPQFVVLFEWIKKEDIGTKFK